MKIGKVVEIGDRVLPPIVIPPLREEPIPEPIEIVPEKEKEKV